MRRSAVLCAVAAVAGCRSLEEELRADREEVVAAADGRTPTASANPDTRDGDLSDPAISMAARTLLADGLTEEEAVRIALLEHRGLAAELERLGIARADLRKAALPPNPIFSASWKLFSGDDEIELGLSQSFLELLLLPVRKRVAEAERTAVIAAVTRALVHHTFEVRRAFVDVLASEGLAASHRREVEAAESAAMLMGKLHDAGSVTDMVFTQAEIEAAEARDGEWAAEAARDAAREALNRALGLWGGGTSGDIDWKPVGELAPVEVSGVARSDVARPDVRDTAMGHTAAGHAAAGHTTAGLADATLTDIESRAVAASLDLAEQRARLLAAGERAGVRDWDSILAPGELGVAAKHETSDQWGVGPSAAIGLPLFDLGGAAAFRAEAELRRERFRELALAVAVRSRARAAVVRLRSLATRANAARDVDLPLHARLVRETVQQYNAMQIGAFDVLTARRGELAAEREALRLTAAARTAKLDLDELLAGSLAADTDRDGGQ